MEPVMVVEVVGSHDRVRARHRIAVSGGEGHCTVGRSAECDIVLDDPFVAATHARVAIDSDGHVFVSDLGTVNGIEIGGQRVHGVQRLPLADGVFRIGRTRLRVRTGHEVIPPEQADHGGRSQPTRAAEYQVLAAAFAVSIAASVFEVWTSTEQPRDLSTALVTRLLAILAIAGLWISLWALVSRVAFGESRWVRHATTLFLVYAGVTLVDLALDLVNGALGLHLPSEIGPVLFAIAASVTFSRHLRDASPMRTRVALAIGLTVPAVILVAGLWVQARSQNRSPSYIADHDQLVPPALLVRRGVSLDAYVTGVADLKAKADAKRAFVEREDPSPEEDDSD